MEVAVARRLEEELGVVCAPRKVFEGHYDLDVGSGLREVEYNHTYLGILDVDTELTPNPAECSACRWMPADKIEGDLVARPGRYSAWFALLFPKVLDHLPS